MKEKKTIRKDGYAWIVLSVIFLINPTVKVFDILPDFIACIIIASGLKYLAERAPHFEEARSAFIKLSFVSLAKIPAFFIISYAKSSNVQDNDTATLFTFVFTFIEAVLLIVAVKNLYSGAVRLAERTDADSLIQPFPIAKRSQKLLTPDALLASVYAFIILRGVLTAVPEMLLLTDGLDYGAHIKVIRPRKLYPYVIVLSVIIVFVVGILLAKRICAYLRAVHDEGKLRSAAESLIDEARATELARDKKIKSIKSTLTLITAASFCTIELCFRDFEGANLLPHFIFGILMIIALYKLQKHCSVHKYFHVFTIAFTIISAVAYFFQVKFIYDFGYSSLAGGSVAKNAYLPVIYCSAAEFILLLTLITAFVLTLRNLVMMHTGIPRESERYSMADAEYHKRMRTRVYIWGGIGATAGLAKLADVMLKYFSSVSFVATDGGIGAIVTGLIPWFNLVVLVTAAAFIGFTLYFFSEIKEEIEHKYI